MLEALLTGFEGDSGSLSHSGGSLWPADQTHQSSLESLKEVEAGSSPRLRRIQMSGEGVWVMCSLRIPFLGSAALQSPKGRYYSPRRGDFSGMGR